MFSKSDILGSLILGLLIAVLFLVLSYTTLTVLRPDEPPPLYYWASLLVFPMLTAAGFAVVKDLSQRLGEKLSFLFQFYKFVLVGVLNTLLDLSILNGLIVLTGITAGWHFSLFKGISFAAAVINSYFWNKFWTFRFAGGVKSAEFGKFIVISGIGLGMNVGAASFLVNIIGPLGGIKPQLWASVSALASIGITTIWNFIGYKVFVFRSSSLRGGEGEL